MLVPVDSTCLTRRVRMAQRQLDNTDAGRWSGNKAPCNSVLRAPGGCFLFAVRCLAHVDLRSFSFKRNFVHSNLHQVDTAPVFSIEVFDCQGIGNLIGVESMSLI